MTTATAPTRTAPLYLGDNGRLTCAALRCAGMTAHASGMRRDLSGGRMDRLTPEDARTFAAMIGRTPTCEGCGAEASLLA